MSIGSCRYVVFCYLRTWERPILILIFYMDKIAVYLGVSYFKSNLKGVCPFGLKVSVYLGLVFVQYLVLVKWINRIE